MGSGAFQMDQYIKHHWSESLDSLDSKNWFTKCWCGPQPQRCSRLIAVNDNKGLVRYFAVKMMWNLQSNLWPVVFLAPPALVLGESGCRQVLDVLLGWSRLITAAHFAGSHQAVVRSKLIYGWHTDWEDCFVLFHFLTVIRATPSSRIFHHIPDLWLIDCGKVSGEE